MNKVYKLKFNRTLEQLVVVSEIATNAEAGTFDNKVFESDDNSSAIIKTDLEPYQPRTLSKTLLRTGLYLGSALSLAASGILQSYALTGAQVVAGQALIEQNGSVTTIKNAPNTIINWQSFNIAKGDLVQFIQESSNSAVLNRVLGTQASEILGTLKSNGQVFLINPNGIIFGKSAVVDTNTLVASTLNIKNEDFLQGNYVFNQEKDQAIASVLNQGLIKINGDGSLALIGGNVTNAGILEAKNGTVYLLAGQTIQIADFNNPLISYKVTAGNKAINLGEIVGGNVRVLAHEVSNGNYDFSNAISSLYEQANESKLQSRISATGEVELFAGSVSDKLQNNQQKNSEVTGERSGAVFLDKGTIDVSNASGKAGTVKVLGDFVGVGDVSILANGSTGGYVKIGGDYRGTGDVKLSNLTIVNENALISVAGKEGDAGNAIVWGDTLNVKGGHYEFSSEQGKGGLFETSGKTVGAENIQLIDSPTSLGKGTWLIDPSIIYIFSHWPNDAEKKFKVENSDGEANWEYWSNQFWQQPNSKYAYYGNNIEKNNGWVRPYFKSNDINSILVKGYQLHLQASDKIVIHNANLYDNKTNGGLYLEAQRTFIDKSTIDISRLGVNSNVADASLNGLAITNSNITVRTEGDFNFTYGFLNISDSSLYVGSFGVGNALQNFSASGIQLINTTFTVGSSFIPNPAKNYRNKFWINVYQGSNLIVNDNYVKNVSGSINLAKEGRFDLTKVTCFSDIVVDVQIDNSKITTKGGLIASSLYNLPSEFSNFQLRNNSVLEVGDNFSVERFRNFNATNSKITVRNAGWIKASEAVRLNNVTYTLKLNDSNNQGTISAPLVEIYKSRVVLENPLKLEIGASSGFIDNSSVNISQSNISTKGLISVNTGTQNFKLEYSNLTSACTTAGVRLIATTGNHQLFQSNLAANSLTVQGNKLSLNQSTVCLTQGGNLQLSNSGAGFFVDKSKVTSGAIDLNITTRYINITCSTFTTPNLYVTLEQGGTVDQNFVDSNFTVNGTGLTINSSSATGATTLNFSNTNVSSSQNSGGFKFVTTNSSLNITNSKFNVYGFNATHTTGGDVKVNGLTNITSRENIIIDRQGNTNNKYEIYQTNLTAAGYIYLRSQGDNSDTAKLNLTDSYLKSSGKTSLVSSNKIEGDASAIAGDSGVEFRGTIINLTNRFDVKSLNSEISIGDGNTQDVYIKDSTFIAGVKNTLDITNNKDVSISGSKSVTITSAGVDASRDVNISSSAGKISLVNTNAITAQRSFNITANSIELSDKTRLTGKDTGHLEATKSVLNIDPNLLTVNNKFTGKGYEGVTVTKDFSVGEISLISGNGTVSVAQGLTVTATKGFANLTGKGVDLQGTVKADVADVQIKSTADNITITGTAQAATNVVIESALNTNVSGGKVLGASGGAINSQDTTTLSKNATINSAKGSVSVVGQKKVISTTGTDIRGNLAVTVESTQGTVSLTNTTVNSDNLSATITGATGVELNNTSLTAKSAATVRTTGTNSQITLKGGSDVVSSTGVATLTGVNIDVQSGSEVKGNTDANIKGTGRVTISDATVKGVNGKATVQGKDLTTNNGTLITGKTDVTVEATNGNASLTGTNVTSTSGTATVKATKDVTLTNSNVSGTDAIVNSTAGATYLTSACVTAGGDTTIGGTKGIVTSSATVTGKTVTIDSGANIKADNSVFNATNGKIAVRSSTSNILNNTSVNGTQVTVSSSTNTVALENKASITATDTANISAKTVYLNATTGVTAQNGVLLEGTDGNVNITNAVVKSTTGTINASATNGAVWLNQAKLYGSQAGITISATKGIVADNSNLTGKSVELSTDANIKATGTEFTASAGDVSINSTTANQIVDSKVTGNNVQINSLGTTATSCVTISNTTVNATSGNATISGAKGVTIDMAAQVLAQKAISIEAVEGDAIVSGAKTLVQGKTVTVKGVNSAQIKQSTVKGETSVEITSTGTADLIGATVNATAGDASVTAVGVTLKDNAQVQGNSALVDAKTGTALIQGGSDVIGRDTTAKVVGNAVTIEGTGTEVKGKTGASVTANAGAASITGAVVCATASGNACVTASKALTLKGGTDVTSVAAKAIVTGESVDVQATGTEITGATGAIVNSTGTTATGTIKLNGAVVCATSSGEAIVSSKGQMTLTNSCITGKSGATVYAGGTGNNALTGTNVTTDVGMANITTVGSATLTTSNVSGDSFRVASGTGNNASVVISGSSLNATAGDGLLYAPNGRVAVKNNSKVNASNDLNITASKGIPEDRFSPAFAITVEDSNLTSGNNLKLAVTGTGDVKISGAGTTSGTLLKSGNIDVYSRVGNVYVDPVTQINATTGSVNITANAIEVGSTFSDDQIYIQAQNQVKLNATSASLSMVHTNITSLTGEVLLQGKGAVTADASNISGTTIKMVAGDEAQVVSGSKIKASKTVSIAGDGVKIEGPEVYVTSVNGTTITSTSINTNDRVLTINNAVVNTSGTGDTVLKATQNSISLTDAEVKAAVGNVEVEAVNEITSTGITTIEGSAKASVKSTAGLVSLEGTTVKAATGEASVQGHTDVSLTANSRVESAQGAASVTATSGELTLTNAVVKAAETGRAVVYAGDVATISHADVVGQQVDVTVGSGTIDQSSNLTASEGLTIKATQGDLSTDTGVVFNGKTIDVNATAGGLSFTDTTIGVTVAPKDPKAPPATSCISIAATGDISASNSKLQVEGRNKDATITVDSKQGSLTLEKKASVTATLGTVTLQAGSELNPATNPVDAQKTAALTVNDATVAANTISATAKTGATFETATIRGGLGGTTVTTEKGVLSATKSCFTASLQGCTTLSGGSFSITDSCITAGNRGSASLTATEDATPGKISTITNLTITGTAVTVEATVDSASISASDLTATASAGDVKVQAGKDLTLKGANTISATAAKDQSSTATVGSKTGAVTISPSTKTLDDGSQQVQVTTVTADKVDLTSGTEFVAKSFTTTANKQGVTFTTGGTNLTDSVITSAAAISITASTENITLSNTSLQATTGDITGTAQKNVFVHSGSKITPTAGGVSFTATAEKVSVKQSNVTATAGKSISFTGATGLEVDNANFSAGDSITLTTAQGDSKVNKANLTATAGSIKLGVLADTTQQHTGALTITDSKLVAQTKAEVRGTSISLTDTNVTTIDSEISIGDANTTGTVVATNSNFSAGGGKAQAAAGVTKDVDIAFRGDGGVSIIGGKVDAARDINFTANSGTVLLCSTCVTQGRSLNITAENIHINHTDLASPENLGLEARGWVQVTCGSHISSEKALTISGGKYVNITDSDVKGTESLTLKSTKEFVNLERGNATSTGAISVTAGTKFSTQKANITSTGAGVTATAGGDITLGNGTIVAGSTAVSVESTGGALDAKGTNISSKNEGVTVKAANDIKLDNSNVTGKANVDVSTSGGAISATGSKLASQDGGLTVRGAQGVTAKDYSFSGNATTTIGASAGEVSLTNGSVSTREGVITITGRTGITTTDSSLDGKKGVTLTCIFHSEHTYPLREPSIYRYI